MDLEGPQLLVYAGGMAGGKTGQAILEMQRIAEGTHYKVKVFQPRNAVRKAIDKGRARIVSRGGPYFLATIIPENEPQEMLARIARSDLCVLIDEAHMFTNPRGLKEVIENLLDQRKNIHAVTLTTDYGGRMFPITKYLLGRASSATFHNGFCSDPGCTRPANHSQLYRKAVLAPYEGAKLFTGDIKKGEIRYKIRCVEHFEIPPNAAGYKEEEIQL